MPNFEITDAMGRTHVAFAVLEERVAYVVHGTSADFEIPPHEREHEATYELPQDTAKLRNILLCAHTERQILRAQRQKRKLRPVTIEQMISLTVAIETLKLVRTKLKHAGCPKTLAKVHSALKSAEGAYRHAERRWEASKPKPAA